MSDSNQAKPAAPLPPTAMTSHVAQSPWAALSDPLAGYAQLLATLLASEFQVQAAVVRLETDASEAPLDSCALGARYAGAVSAAQLTHWAAARFDHWLRHDRSTHKSPVHECELLAKQANPADTGDHLFFKKLKTRHALLTHHPVGTVMLRIGLFLIPLQPSAVMLQAAALMAALPAITGRLALVIAPPVVTAKADTLATLSTAEREIFPLLLQRSSERAIAERLNKSRNTIHAHVKNIYLKLDVHSRKELRAKATHAISMDKTNKSSTAANPSQAET